MSEEWVSKRGGFMLLEKTPNVDLVNYKKITLDLLKNNNYTNAASIVEELFQNEIAVREAIEKVESEIENK